MIDLEQEVEITLCSSNISYYEEKGYNIESLRKPNRDKIMTIPRGTKLNVKITDLPTNASNKIKVKCDYCGKCYHASYVSINKRKNEIIEKDSCNDCKFDKIKDSNLIKYGKEYATSKYDLGMAIEIFKNHNATLLAEEFIQVKNLMPYVCDIHPEGGIQYTSLDCVNQDSFCKFCKIDSLKLKAKPFDKIKVEFDERGYDALYESKIKHHRVIHYICRLHPEKGEQKSYYSNFIRGNGCKECHFEKYRGKFGANWKGGISELTSFLRENISDWKLSSRKLSNYKCVLTGLKFKNIHHLHGFDNILREMKEFAYFDIGLKINQYSEEELETLKRICNSLHAKYGLGVCLSNEIHKLFHLNYGYGNNTHAQFKQFIKRLQFGEFDEYLVEHNLTLNLNYEALNKLALL